MRIDTHNAPGPQFWAKLIAPMFGDNYLQITSAHQLLGNFNALLANRTLLHCDEAGFFGGYKDQQV